MNLSNEATSVALRSVVDPFKPFQTNPFKRTLYENSLPPLDAASSPTGNLLYAVTERYVDALGVKEHMKIGAERWSGFPELAELVAIPDASLSPTAFSSPR